MNRYAAAWRVAPQPYNDRVQAALRGVATAADDVWAIGWDIVGGAWIMRGNGSAWGLADSGTGEQGLLLQVDTAGPANDWAGGDSVLLH